MENQIPEYQYFPKEEIVNAFQKPFESAIMQKK
jgi:hypothetical protein